MEAIAVFPRKKEVGIIDVEEPLIQHPKQVKIKILETGICGTDREIARFEYGIPPPDDGHLIIGHESLGQVVEVGNEVSRLAEGDLVVCTVRRGCKENCLSCRNQESDMCFTGSFVERGIKEAHGYMTSYVVEEEEYVAKLPNELRDIGVLLEPLTVSEKAIKEILQIQSRLHWECELPGPAQSYPCRVALVLGAGPIGFLASFLLSIYGFQTYVLSRERKGGLADSILKSAGIGYFSSQEDSLQSIGDELGNIDVILEATGSSQLSFDMMPLLGTNGVFVLTGVPGHKSIISLDADVLMRNIVLKNQVILGTVNANLSAFKSGVEHLSEFTRRFPEAITRVITTRVPFSQYKEPLKSKQPGEIKTVLRFAEPVD